MSIGKRVSETIDKMEAGDPEGALFQICAAVEVTAKKECGRSGGPSYKEFLHSNLGLITDIAFGFKILNLNLTYNHSKLPTDSQGTAGIQDILYHVVRCGLYHEASLPGDLQFVEKSQIRSENGVLFLPSSLIYGLISAVVVAPVNAGEHAPKEGAMNFGDFPILINKLWGRRNELLWLLDATNELAALRRAAERTS